MKNIDTDFQKKTINFIDVMAKSGVRSYEIFKIDQAFCDAIALNPVTCGNAYNIPGYNLENYVDYQAVSERFIRDPRTNVFFEFLALRIYCVYPDYFRLCAFETSNRSFRNNGTTINAGLIYIYRNAYFYSDFPYFMGYDLLPLFAEGKEPTDMAEVNQNLQTNVRYGLSYIADKLLTDKALTAFLNIYEYDRLTVETRNLIIYTALDYYVHNLYAASDISDLDPAIVKSKKIDCVNSDSNFTEEEKAAIIAGL